MVDTNHEWIVQRTGIYERRIAAEGQFCSDLIFEAVRDMQSRYSATVEDVDFVLVATTTPDTFVPSMAARVQAEFGIRSCGVADIQAACAGFVTALQMAGGLLLTGAYRKILVIGAETLSKATDYTDRSTCILFGDGAGAALLETADEGAFLASTRQPAAATPIICTSQSVPLHRQPSDSIRGLCRPERPRSVQLGRHPGSQRNRRAAG